jgi:lipoprotein-releasing system ATP-binding protein
VPNNQTLIHFNQVTKRYTNPSGTSDHEVLSNVTLSIQAGETLAIVGPSGSGKSTLLNLCGLLDKPTSGQILFNNQDSATLSEPQAATVRNQDIGFVFQLHHLLPQCTVLENVMLPTLPAAQQDQQAILQRARDLISNAGLQQRMHHRPAELSGGEQLRVAVARALINQPKLLLADEPTGSLDQNTAKSISDVLLSLNQQYHCTLVVVTHSHDLAQKMETLYELKDGKLFQQ